MGLPGQRNLSRMGQREKMHGKLWKVAHPTTRVDCAVPVLTPRACESRQRRRKDSINMRPETSPM
eukprot:8195159-Pyramimonas_sp.AAC.1